MQHQVGLSFALLCTLMPKIHDKYHQHYQRYYIMEHLF